jgi:RHS repeat-associated protein
MRRYTEQYEYDAVGNILAMIHQARGSGWTRHYEHATDSNRLLATSLPGDNPAGPYSARYDYTAHGSMAAMPHLPLMFWDFAEHLQASSSQVVNDGTPETTYYVYDGAGQRVRKVTERQAGEGITPTRMKERVYLGAFEIYREYDGGGKTISLERETLHVMDDKQRIALIETRIQGDDGSPAQLLRYQLSNHLGSASVELDEIGRVISYEEYFPYGSTSYQAVNATIKAAAKRYRYTGMEKDEETGLAYHGARYYAGWMGRWVSVDPLSISDGLNLYRYVRNNPAMLVDREGSQTGISECSTEPNFLNASDDELALAAAEHEKQRVENRAAYEALLHQTVRDISDPGGYQAGSSGAVAGRILVNWLWFGVAPDASDAAVVLTDAKNTKIIAMGNRYAMASTSGKAPVETAPSALPAATVVDMARGPGGPTRSGGGGGAGSARPANREAIPLRNPLPPDFVDAPPEQPGSFNPNVAKTKLLDAAEENDTLLQRSHLGQEPFTRTAGPEITLAGHGVWDEGAGYTIVPENTWVQLFEPVGEVLLNSKANDVERGLLDPVRIYGPGEVIPNMRLLPPANAADTLQLVGDPIFLHPMQQQGLLLSEILVPGLGPVNWAACSVCRRDR